MAITTGQAGDLAASTGHARSRRRCSWAAGHRLAPRRGPAARDHRRLRPEVRVLRLEHDGTAPARPRPL